jgi:hypothetical protein
VQPDRIAVSRDSLRCQRGFGVIAQPLLEVLRDSQLADRSLDARVPFVEELDEERIGFALRALD